MEPEFEWWCNVKHESGTNDAATATASAGRAVQENALGMQPLSVPLPVGTR
jgi:hypothetical protein